ncbi:hypothetical protein PHYPSEUDO_000024 [Phytophthora pseudosyringae]|uniref:Uncharacterized protein n=1 Tax=Phytophthora pseudosyringae TaxID=221518 RepID=A0A8T1WIV7_9STRA|nr:hypothetical protein PHYPSEUDO_000024 [Phytophthora pseudosyringae]
MTFCVADQRSLVSDKRRETSALRANHFETQEVGHRGAAGQIAPVIWFHGSELGHAGSKLADDSDGQPRGILAADLRTSSSIRSTPKFPELGQRSQRSAAQTAISCHIEQKICTPPASQITVQATPLGGALAPHRSLLKGSFPAGIHCHCRLQRSELLHVRAATSRSAPLRAA